ncbi:TPA: recombinase family protein [Citrobacter amalonaticus]|uniref:recombinase family protein n=1 Tax=Enterobacteriaceae TaxID=543 RepID=UPI0024B7D02D|nr:recombinase family protein [Citrobacter koseri]MDI9803773.1 recombinase family protein [Citrobacter koseri]HBL0735094.1 recombinase family protein [Kluyvera ascorbata]HED1307204.1 recombinase family protein [Kluyvera ascorbata]
MSYYAYFTYPDRLSMDYHLANTNDREIIKKYRVQSAYVIIECCVSHITALERPQFSDLLNKKTVASDTLIVPNLSSIGIDALDIRKVIDLCERKNLNLIIHSLELLSLNDITSFLDDFILLDIEKEKRKHKNRIDKAKENGNKLGRPEGSKHHHEIQELKDAGYSQMKISLLLGINLSTVKRNWRNGIIEY